MERYRRIFGPAMMLLGIIAFILSIVLTLHALSLTGLVGCSAGSSCDQVTGSRWSMLLGFLPVSAVSMSLYLAVLVCLAYLFIENDALVKKILLGLCSALVPGSLWFIFIQHFMVHAFCPYCMSAHICGILLSMIAFIWLRKDKDISRSLFGKIAGAGAAVVALFVVFQLITTPTYRAQTGRIQDPLPIPDVASAPFVGPEDAEHVVALLYDYQCPHCKVIHGFLEEVSDRLGGRVAFVMCPSPLSPVCNPYIPSGQDRFPGSCTMAKLALSIWNHDPDAFDVFDSWLWEETRTETDCIAKAQEICPEASLDDPWVMQYLSRSLEIFARTSMSGKGGIPRLVSGDSWLVPETDRVEDLVKLVEELIAED